MPTHSVRPVGMRLRHAHHAAISRAHVSAAPQIACSSEGAPIHALLAKFRPFAALPKATAIPISLALATIVPAATNAPPADETVGGSAYSQNSLTGAPALPNRRAGLPSTGSAATVLANELAFGPMQQPVLPLQSAAVNNLPSTMAGNTDLSGGAGGGGDTTPPGDTQKATAQVAVPEPSSWPMLALGLLVLLVGRYRLTRR